MGRTRAEVHPPAQGGQVDRASESDELDFVLRSRALRGDIRAISLLERRGRQQRLPNLDVGQLETTSDLSRAQVIILKAAATGDISASDARKLGEQIELLGLALERNILAKKIDEMAVTLGNTREGLLAKSIKKQVDLVSVALKKQKMKREASWDECVKEYGDRMPELEVFFFIFSCIHLLAGMDRDDFSRLGDLGVLPRSMQDMNDTYERIVMHEEPRDRRARRMTRTRLDPPPRWMPNAWSCSCQNMSTLWVPSDLSVPDHIQVYCDSCFKLVGWGTDAEFDDAHAKDQASWIERSEEDVIKKLKTKPVMGVKAYFKLKNIEVVTSQSDDEIDEFNTNPIVGEA